MCSRPVAEDIYPRVLMIDVSLPGWAAVKSSLCEALGNALCMGAATTQLGERLSIYTIRERHQCVLPLQEMRGNLCRLQRCLSELRALPMEGSGALRIRSLSLAVLDSLQQNKQRMQHSSSGTALHSCLVERRDMAEICHHGGLVPVEMRRHHWMYEVAIVSPRPGRELICDLDVGLKDSDLSTLRRLLVLHISCELEENGSPEPETPPDQGSHVYDIDSHVTLPNVLSLEIFFKSWLLDRNSEKEKCHLKFPEGASDFSCSVEDGDFPIGYLGYTQGCVPLHGAVSCALEVICDVNRPLLNPGLLHGEEAHPRGLTLPANTGYIQTYKVIRAVSSPGVCGSMFYGLPTILTPTACWELDWDQLEANQDNFHALCHCLQSQQLSLVACSPQHSSSWAPAVLPHVLVSSSGSAALLLRQLAVRELVLLMKVPTLPPAMAEHALHRMQDALHRLEADVVYNPLQMNSNLYRHLQVILTQPQNPRRHISAGPSRQVTFTSGRARATIAPLHFASPGLGNRRRAVNDSPSPKRRLLQDEEGLV